jgi:Domain of unknown function (DUF4129)
LGAPQPPADEARQRADEILSRPEFRPPEKTWFEEALEWLDEAARSFLNSLLSGGAGSIIAWVVLGVLVAIVVVLAARVSRTVQSVPVHGMKTDIVPRRSSVDWRGEAERLEADGQWKDALRCRYRALVSELIERDVLRDVPGRTTGEYRVELREHAPAAAASFAGASELFERAWYGDRPTGPDESERFRTLAREALVGARS